MSRRIGLPSASSACMTPSCYAASDACQARAILRNNMVTMRSLALVALLLPLALTACSCTTVRQLKPAATVKVDAPTERTRSEDALDYSVAKTIHAPPAAVWK